MAEHDVDTGTAEGTPTRPQPGQLLCPVCWSPFTPTGRQRYCTDSCRKTAWRRRTITRSSSKPAGWQRLSRQDPTIYACPSCSSRYQGQQRCPGCNQPGTRIGLGGPCPHCQQPVALTDLLDPTPADR